jgi:GC-rich sequence DNA-binding factor
MISTAVVPRICKLVEGGAFDPYSSRHTRRLIDLVEQLEVSVEGDNHKLQVSGCQPHPRKRFHRVDAQTLLKAVFSVFSDAVSAMDGIVTPHMAVVNPRFDPEAIPARRRLLARQSKLLHSMLRWRKHTGEKFGIGQLVTMFVGECMLPIAETGWDVGGEERMRKVRPSLQSPTAGDHRLMSAMNHRLWARCLLNWCQMP